MIADDREEVAGPIDTPAGNWEYRMRDDDGKLVAQLAIDGGHFAEGEADFIAKHLKEMVMSALKMKREGASRIIRPGS